MNKLELTIQKEGKALIPAEWPSSGIVEITDLAGKSKIAKAIQSTSAGMVSVHLLNDYDGNGVKAWTLVSLTAEALVTGGLVLNSANEVPCAFDEIRSTGTTITLSALTVWI